MFVVVHQIYELASEDPKTPVVEHRFFGRTRARAMAIFRAHMKTDSFLRGCQNSGRYKSIPCRTEIWVEEI